MGLEQQQENFFVDKVVSDQDARFKELSDRLAFLEAQEGAAGISIALLEDQKSSGTEGGTSSVGIQTRVLNTEVYDPDGIVSLAANQFTLSAGTYLIEWSVPAYDASRHQGILYNVTGAAILKRGSSEFDATTLVSTVSFGAYVVTIASGTNVYEIRHYIQTARVTTGLGVASSNGGEVYTQVKITKLP